MSVISRVLKPSTHSLLDRLESYLGRMVLDVGCGGGGVALELARRIRAPGHVVGIDLDETQLKFAREDAAKHGNLVQPYGRADDIKQVVLLTLEGISDRIISFGIATPDELMQVDSDLQTFFEQENSTISCPRIFQVWGNKRQPAAC